MQLKDTASVRARGVEKRARELSVAYHGTFGHSWVPVLPAFSVTMGEHDAQMLSTEPDVAYVEQSQRSAVAGTVSQANPPSWGLDRIDQRALPLDHTYRSDDSGGATVHAYIVDSGIRIDHSEFGGRASYGRDTYDNDDVAGDCNGHGTGVAGVVGGNTYGVAKKVQLVAVRVFNCDGMSGTNSVEDGLAWVVQHAIKPAVINLSIGQTCKTAAGQTTACPAGSRQSLVNMINAAISAGIPVVVSAGNDDIDACGNPFAAVPDAITVGATDMNDARWVFLDGIDGSDYGPCVDIWAPGDQITTAYKDSTTATQTKNGTSFSAPHVTGAVALLMGTSRFKDATPAQITAQLLSMTTDGVLTDINDGSPNKLLFTPVVAGGGSSIALVRNQNKRLELFGVNSDGYVFHRSEVTAGTGAWDVWIRSDKKGWFSVGAEPGADNRIELATLTSADRIWHRQQATINNISYFRWASLDGLLTSVAMARNGDGRLEMVGANKDGQAFYRKQTDANSMSWGQWHQFTFPDGSLHSVTAATNAEGKIEVAGIDNFGNVWHTAQITASLDVWSAFTVFDNTFVTTELALASNNDGTLELVGTDGEGKVWRRAQTTADHTTWTTPTNLPPKLLRHIAAETDANDLVTVVGVDNAGNIWQTRQTTVNSASYTPWTQIDGQLRS